MNEILITISLILFGITFLLLIGSYFGGTIALGILIAFIIFLVLVKVRGSSQLAKIEEEGRQIVARQEKERVEAELERTVRRSEIETQREQCLDEMSNECFKITDKHRLTLIKKHGQIITRDDYGIVIGLDKWGEEVSYFVENILLPEPAIRDIIVRRAELQEELEVVEKQYIGQETRDQLRASSFDADVTFLRTVVRNWIEMLAQEKSEKFGEIDFETMSGAMFEIFCQETLQNTGWSVVRKGGTGDQGVDLIAKREGVVVAIQCKRYSKPVGNKAVQEVEAGRQFEQAHRAAVVSTADYTPAARQLASSLGVLLLHHEDLERLHEVIAP